jgi:hypothetical protein
LVTGLKRGQGAGAAAYPSFRITAPSVTDNPAELFSLDEQMQVKYRKN